MHLCPDTFSPPHIYARHIYAKTLVHQEVFFYRRAFTPSSFDANTVLLHQEPSAPQHFYTTTLLNLKAFTPRSFCAKELLIQDFYTNTVFRVLHHQAFAPSHLCTKKLHQRAFCTQKLHQQLLHREPSKQEALAARSFYTKKHLNQKTRTPRRLLFQEAFYTKTLRNHSTETPLHEGTA